MHESSTPRPSNHHDLSREVTGCLHEYLGTRHDSIELSIKYAIKAIMLRYSHPVDSIEVGLEFDQDFLVGVDVTVEFVSYPHLINYHAGVVT